MTHLNILYPVLKAHIYSFLSYDDKRSVYRMLECKRPTRPVIRIDDIPNLYNAFLREDIILAPSIRDILNENWFLPIIDKGATDMMLPCNVIQLCILKEFLNRHSDRDEKVYMQCPRCRMYNQMNLILFNGKLILDVYSVNGIYKQDYIHGTVYFCDCAVQQYPPEIVFKDDEKGNGDHRESTQQYSNVIMNQYKVLPKERQTEVTLYQKRVIRFDYYKFYDHILKAVLQLYGYVPEILEEEDSESESEEESDSDSDSESD